jgi:ATP-dependent helicase HrpB
MLPELPVAEVLPELRAALAQGHAVLAAPPGSGKTTLVPLALLGEAWLADSRIVMLEPRRLAARAAAARMAEITGTEVGDRIGYQVRFDRRIGARTRIEVLTEGVLTRRLQGDPELRGVGLVIFDEFHERSVHADLALALCLDVARSLREDLRILVMSATLDTAPVAALLGGAPVVRGEGRQFPVELRYLERPAEGPLVSVVERATRRALVEQRGDLLVFLPGGGEIRALAERLAAEVPEDLVVAPLYGDLPKGDQDAAIRPRADGRRRVVLATDIAETSLTIDGVSTVVDGGYCRQPRFDPNRGLSRLQTLRISRASAEQRAGRAGRQGPGVCYRLWTEPEQRGLAERAEPEIRVADLAPLALELLRWGVTDPSQLTWLDPPPPAHWAQALDGLRQLDLIDAAGRLTTIGVQVAAVGAEPRLGLLLVQGAARGVAPLAADVVAVLEERDPLRARRGEPAGTDIELRLHALGAARNRQLSGDVDGPAIRRLERAARHWSAVAARLPAAAGEGESPSVGGLLSLAFADRIARRRGESGARYLLASGRGVTLPEADPLATADFIVVPDLDAGRADGRVFLAAQVPLGELRTLHRSRILCADEVRWDGERGLVRAERAERLGAVVISATPLAEPDPAAVAQALCAALRSSGAGVLGWSDSARQLQARVAFLRRHDPEGGWPDLADDQLAATLEDWLGPWLIGLRRLDDIRRVDLVAILLGLLGGEQRQRLERLAPEYLRVPSGSRKRIDYARDPPVLAVKLQEMFGLADTPRLCAGRVAVMLHLLSPAQRPVQITQDLAGFWARGYGEVRRELRGRYPKHPWPDDPWNAVPSARTKPRP